MLTAVRFKKAKWELKKGQLCHFQPDYRHYPSH